MNGGERFCEQSECGASHPAAVASSSSSSSWPSGGDVNHNYYYHHHHHDQNFNASNFNPHYHHNSNRPDHQQHFDFQSFHSNGGAPAYGFTHALPLSGRKRDHMDSVIASHAKLYVSQVPRTASVDDIRPLFEQFGNIVEVVILKDKRTGYQQGSCFVKYSTIDEAEKAIRALNTQFTFPGEMVPITVKYADGERERLAILDKVFVGYLNRDATKKEIEEIFSPYGVVEDVYIVRDEMKQSRGCGFVKFSHKDMALAAIKALNGMYTMRGCDQPFIVRFADPKKPKGGETRGNTSFSGTNFGPHMQEPVVRRTTNPGDSMVGHNLPNAPYPLQHFSSTPQPQGVSLYANQEPQTPNINQQPFPSLQNPSSQLSQMPLQQTQNLQRSAQSFQAVPEMQKQMHLIQPSMESLEQQQWSQGSGQQTPQTGNNTQAVASNSVSPVVPVNAQVSELECDWSEHTCPDGYKYYYNCVTCESRWEKPEEFAIFEQQVKKQIQPHNPSNQFQSPLPVHSMEQVAQTQQVQHQTHVFHQKLQHQQSSLSASSVSTYEIVVG
ncbi:flowering time control protein FCA isoform X1 [Ziziphus jujuba]|uniref:Flowering time control protein FCA isoform X1 n=1 Tax=Ziziphus jujuba TaxID=326968 RepID=A0A6P6GFZ1_ZIZJJ|nr:flowering time control protein FCA isoform X1 [Ziziphus jujuba]